jgi:phospholipase/carboxylesterase
MAGVAAETAQVCTIALIPCRRAARYTGRPAHARRAMRTPGEPVRGQSYAFDFVTLEPRPEAPRTLAVLLHGVGGDETQLAALGDRLPEDALVAMPRGQRTISGDRLGWFREGLSEDGPQVVEDEAEEARARLVEFVQRLQERFDVPPARTVLAGFSQGGMLAAAAALTGPGLVAGFAMAGGRIMPELAPRLPHAGMPAELHALVVHGRHDEVLPVDWATRAVDLLAGLGIARELRLHEAGHELTAAMERDIAAWYASQDRPWMRADAGVPDLRPCAGSRSSAPGP